MVRQANNLDAAAVIPVTVPTADPTLRFLAKYGAEFGFDYGYVQVSTDGGATYTASRATRPSTRRSGPASTGRRPALSRTATTCRRMPVRRVLLGFRYVSDGGVNEGGLLLDDITRRRDAGQRRVEPRGVQVADPDPPHPVHNWNVRLVGIDEAKSPLVLQVEFNGKNNISLNRASSRCSAPSRRSSRSWPTTSRPSRCSSTRRTP